MLKAWFRKWLGIDVDRRMAIQDNFNIRNLHDKNMFELSKAHNITLDRLQKLEQEVQARMVKLEVGLRPPIKQRLEQLQSGINILTSFANEIYEEARDSEKM